MLVLTGILSLSSLRAQYISFSGSNGYTGSDDFEFQTGGTLIAKGITGTGSLTPGDQGSGTRLLWYANKAAFRAGRVNTTTTTGGTVYLWDDSNIGNYSVAMGYNVSASTQSSVALGQGSTASGSYAVAIGYGNTAGATNSTALGYNTTASGNVSTAFGDGTFATGNRATTFGGGTTTAYGSYSFAAGYHSYASGTYSATFGLYTDAEAYASVAIGAYNTITGSHTTWVPTDPLFQIGNGTDDTHRSDAFVVDKSGKVTASVFMMTATPIAGDIPMFGH